MCRSGPAGFLYCYFPCRVAEMCKPGTNYARVASPAWRLGVTPRKRRGCNDESIDEQGIRAGSIPDSPIKFGGLGKEKVRSIRTPAMLSMLW